MGENMKKRKKRRETSLFYRFTMSVMCLIMAVLVYLINDKEKIVTMDMIKQFSLSDVNDILFGRFFQKPKEMVSSNVSYQLVKDYFYTNGSNEIKAVMDGIIVSCDHQEIVELCDNGVRIVYKNAISIDVKKDERILKGMLLGTMQDTIEMHFYYDDKEITMKEALAIS